MGPSCTTERIASGTQFLDLDSEWDPRRAQSWRRSHQRNRGPPPAAVDPMEQTDIEIGRRYVDLTDPIP